MTPWPRLNLASDLPATADVVVIGGGIIGAATAFFARRAGLNVVLLEKRSALCTLTTPVSTGAFRLQFDNTEEIALVRPHVLVPLGATAAQALLGSGFRVTVQRGRDIASPLAPHTVATVHPSSILRQPTAADREREMKQFIADLKIVARILTQ